MYSDLLLDHLANPRNGGEIPDPSTRGESTNPVCGDRLILTLRLVEGRVAEAAFLAEGCPPSIAVGSLLTEMVTGRTITELRQLQSREISRALQPLPRNKEHCSTLAIDALRSALANLPATPAPRNENGATEP
jgi:nitrogen fixation NifU-like protein